MRATPVVALLLACATALLGTVAGAQPRTEPEVDDTALPTITEPAQVAAWLQRLTGRFKYDGMIQMGPCAEAPSAEGGPPSPPSGDYCTGIKGKSDCVNVGSGPGVQCILNVTWQDLLHVDFESGQVEELSVSFLDPAMELYGLEPGRRAINRLLVNNKGIADSGSGSIRGNTATFKSPCTNPASTTAADECVRTVRIEAKPDARLVHVWLGGYAVMTLRRVASEQATTVHERLGIVTSDADLDELALAEEDAKEERATLAPGTAVVAAPVPQRPVELPPAPDLLEEVVAEGERERTLKAQTPRQINGPDLISVTRNSTATGNGMIRVRIQPHTPQSELRFRASDARQLPSGARPTMELQQDRLTARIKPPIRDVTLEFATGVDEADGLPALIRINERASLFNVDYVRLLNSRQPLMATLRNVMNPETRRCESALRLGDGGDEFHDRFVLLGDRFGDCNRTIKGREGDLVFADTVPDHVRQELHDFYDPIYNRFSHDLGSEPGVVFVIWRPESPRNDFRFVRSLNRTSLLVLNGPSWNGSFTAQQRDALWEEVAQEQILRRIRWQGQSDAITEAAVDYLLKLARAERQHDTVRRLTTELPEWISACHRAMSLQASVANAPRNIISHDCGLVLQFVHDAVARGNSRGEDTVKRTWRNLLADALRRGLNYVSATAFLQLPGEANRIAQGLQSGAMDWNFFAAELGKVGVQVQVTPGRLAPSVLVLSLTNFHD